MAVQKNPDELSDMVFDADVSSLRLTGKAQKRAHLNKAFKDGLECLVFMGGGTAVIGSIASSLFEGLHVWRADAVWPQFKQTILPALAYTLPTTAVLFTFLRMRDDADVLRDEQIELKRRADNKTDPRIKLATPTRDAIKQTVWSWGLWAGCVAGIISYGDTQARKAVEEYKKETEAKTVGMTKPRPAPPNTYVLKS